MKTSSTNFLRISKPFLGVSICKIFAPSPLAKGLFAFCCSLSPPCDSRTLLFGCKEGVGGVLFERKKWLLSASPEIGFVVKTLDALKVYHRRPFQTHKQGTARARTQSLIFSTFSSESRFFFLFSLLSEISLPNQIVGVKDVKFEVDLS